MEAHKLNRREIFGNYPLAVGSRRAYTRGTQNREEDTPLTVCVAALCERHMIIGASDRMITSDDVQFEHHQSKINQLTSSIAALVAGNTPLQMAALQKTLHVVNERIEAEPTNWWQVKDVADLFAEHYWEEVNKRAEREILSPLGLSLFDFHYRQNDFSPDFIRQLATEMLHFTPPEVETIFAGVDETGGHLYLVINGKVTCEDMVGFVAIGKGYAHAQSQFMSAGHSRHNPLPETLLLTLSAKKRSEVAPGVGPATDMFMIGPELGSLILLRTEIQEGVEAIYTEIRAQEQRLVTESRKQVNDYVEQIERETIARRQALEGDSGGESPSDQKALRDGSEASESESADDNREEPQPGEPGD